MEKNYKQIVAEDRRLAILRFLSEEADFAVNDSVMQKALKQIGHGVAREVVQADYAFLSDLGLISIEIVMNKIHVATLTNAGLDVANGVKVVPGISRPRPE